MAAAGLVGKATRSSCLRSSRRGIAYTASGSLARTMPGWEVICWALVVSLPFSLLASILLFPDNAAAVPSDAWLGLLYSAVMAQWMGFFFWNAGLAMGGISRVSQVQLVQPFVTVGLAALVNREIDRPRNHPVRARGRRDRRHRHAHADNDVR